MATCLRCGNEWEPRKPDPKKCPSCQNPNWNREVRRKRARGANGNTSVLHSEVEGSIPSVSTITEKDTLSEAKARAEELLRKLVSA